MTVDVFLPSWTTSQWFGNCFQSHCLVVCNVLLPLLVMLTYIPVKLYYLVFVNIRYIGKLWSSVRHHCYTHSGTRNLIDPVKCIHDIHCRQRGQCLNWLRLFTYNSYRCVLKLRWNSSDLLVHYCKLLRCPCHRPCSYLSYKSVCVFFLTTLK